MKPKVYVTRRLPEPAMNELIKSCHVEIWSKETPAPPYNIIKEDVRDKQGLLCLLTDRIDAELIAAAPGLEVISQCAVGYDNIDVSAAFDRGILVGNTPGVLTEATADLAFALMLAAARRLGEGIDFVRAGKWETWGLTLLLGQDVYGATLGIVGLGRIGKAVARRASGFDMKVLYYDRVRQAEAEREIGVVYRDFENLLRESDYISIHVGLSDATWGMFNRSAFKRMKETAVLVNTSRGPVVDADALYDALKDGQIASAALDVTDPEPLPAGHRLIGLPNLTVVPHIASATVTSRSRMAMMAVQNLVAGLKGEHLPNPVKES